MHEYSEAYTFTHANGAVIRFGPGDAMRVWRSVGLGPAHELLAAYDGRCYHSPGPGDVFREGDLDAVFRGAVVVQVIHTRAESLEEVAERLARAKKIEGTRWDARFSTCQDCISWIVTGKASSFQRDALVGAALGIGFLALVVMALNTPVRPQRRRRNRY
jgi:hypothetical protein